MITPEREAKFRAVAARRQNNLTVILENVHDPHNIGAVLRTCDSVGVNEIFVLYSEEGLTMENIRLGVRSASGAHRWVDVHLYNSVEACFEHVRSNYDIILATHLDAEAKSIFEVDMTQSIALLFGNEHAGVSEEALAHCDGNFIIPQMGMVQSLNISVACAVTLYEALRQRLAAGMFDKHLPMSPAEQEALYQSYYQRHVDKDKRKSFKAKDWGIG